ncbi:MAG: YqfO family protein [Thiomicrorhabdus chilensis]|uniref:YqfO family protein n=1 Tax=Thiomicrorhabdus chilensis TaxID=63656 RepID=UPI00299DC68C|nr:YqfO family protein [Thiomicrorhabdus chilensis]MDX1346956.1 YqfO family protein [Thiomicrorhabdus chilensis]
MYKFCFFVPESHLEAVKQAVFAAGAGRIGSYDHCCWQAEGMGQFRALEGSRPFIGELGQVEKVKEYKVEMVCDKAFIRQSIGALLAEHPYETPAYEVYQLAQFPD